MIRQFEESHCHRYMWGYQPHECDEYEAERDHLFSNVHMKFQVYDSAHLQPKRKYEKSKK